MAETQLNPNNELKVPVYDAIAQRILDTPLIIRNAILAHLFAPEDLRSLLVVKLSEPEPNPRDLRSRAFEDGIKRYLAFSSGKNYYFGDVSLTHQICDLFTTEPDAACRYSFLLDNLSADILNRLKQCHKIFWNKLWHVINNF